MPVKTEGEKQNGFPENKGQIPVLSIIKGGELKGAE